MAINLPIVSKFDNKGVKAAGDSLDKLGRMAAQVGAAAAAAIGGAAIYAVREFANFDGALQQSVSIMGNVSDALRNDMADAAREVAKTTTFSATEAAESFYFLASAGLDAASSIQAMPQVAKFAQAGMFDMALATDLLTDAQSALGLTVRDDAIKNLENMAAVSDVLVRANTLANASVEQFSTALTTKAGPAMRAVGMDIEEGVAVLAVFADQGIKGEEAGTNFAIVLRDLQTKAIENKDAFKQAGVAVFDAQGEMRNMADIVSDLEGLLGGMSDEQKKATLSTLGFSDKSMGALAALIGTSEQLEIYEEELRKAGGTTQEVADKQLLTFNSQMELLKSRVNDVAIEVGEGLAPKLLELTDAINPIIDKAGPSLVTFFEDLWTAGEDIYNTVKPIVDEAMPGLETVFKNLEEPVSKIVDFLGTLGETVLVAVKDLITNETFQKAVKDVGDGFGKFADEAKRLVESGLVKFLLDISSTTLTGALMVLGQALERISGALANINNFMDLISGKELSFEDAMSALNILPINFEDLIRGFTPQIFTGRQSIPRFAEGGIVPARAGGTLGIIGEAGQSEAVIPLDRLAALSSGKNNVFSITVNAGMGADGSRIGEQIVNEILRFERSSGRVFARA